MDLVEYQGKQIFRRNGVPVPAEGRVCRTVDEVADAARDLFDDGAGAVVVKAQVKTGGRGKAGGVEVVTDVEAARAAGEAILGLDIKGHEVRVVYVEPGSDIAEEYYLSVMHDRVGKGYLVICSVQGGVDIEEVNRTDPDAVVKESLVPGDTEGGLPRERAVDILERARIPAEVLDATADLLVALFDAFRSEDATLAEINPLIRTTDDRIVALDAKVSLDGNAAFRHDGYDEWDLPEAEASDPLEQQARAQGIQYVKLDGTVGVIGNGAGLVMATLDVVAQAGGKAANFLDVGGGASAEEMATSLDLLLRDPQVASVLINIFGGITRCDEIARGVLDALDELGDVDRRFVVRLDGTNAAEGREILTDADHPLVDAATTMQEAAERAVELANA